MATVAPGWCRVFLSFRFGEAHAHALRIKAALASRGIAAFVCDVPPGPAHP